MDEPSLKQRIEALEREVAVLGYQLRHPINLASELQWYGLWHNEDRDFIAASVTYDDLVDIRMGVPENSHLEILPIKVVVMPADEEED